MKKAYFAPLASSVKFETEEVLENSLIGNGTVLGDSEENQSSKNPAPNFGGIDLF